MTNATTLAALSGMLIAAGVVVAAFQLRPAPPKLSAVLAQLNDMSTAAPEVTVLFPATSRSAVWPARLTRYVEAHVGVSNADLAILAMSRAQLAAQKLSQAGIGFLAPSVLTAVLTLLGHPPALQLPVALIIIAAAAGWVRPSAAVKSRAARARVEFEAALHTCMKLVAQRRLSRGSPEEAMEEASGDWQMWAFAVIHDVVDVASKSGSPWRALRELGTELDVEQLRTMADTVSTASDGAAIFDSLLSEAQNGQHAALKARHAEANIASEQLVKPLGLLAFAFVFMIMLPPLLRVMQSI